MLSSRFQLINWIGLHKSVPFLCDFVSGFTGAIPPCSGIVLWDDTNEGITEEEYLAWKFEDTDVDSVLETKFMVRKIRFWEWNGIQIIYHAR